MKFHIFHDWCKWELVSKWGTIYTEKRICAVCGKSQFKQSNTK